jgi:pimeloyl-ACP methyl ester carboxylesterase
MARSTFSVSMGGVAFRLAVQHRRAGPGLDRPAQTDYPDAPWQARFPAGGRDEETPMYKSYVAVAPQGGLPKLLDRMGELMRTPYNWADDVKTLKMPVMLVYGDSDMYRPEHIVEFYHLLGGGLRDAGWMGEHMSPNRLAILPDLTHYDIFLAPALAETCAFLDGRAR